jgi:hypothetical protein
MAVTGITDYLDLADQLTLFQPMGRLCHCITTGLALLKFLATLLTPFGMEFGIRGLE